MRNKFFGKSLFLAKTALLVLMLLCLTTFLNAQGGTTTFATFTEKGGRDFTFVNDCALGNFQTTPAGGSAVLFNYVNIANLPLELQGSQNARLVLTSSTNAPAQLQVNRLVQPITSEITITITRDTPATVGSGSRTNLLTAVITTNTSPSDLAGEQGAGSAAFTASTTIQNVTFTSDFISFTGSSSRNLAIELTGLNQPLSIGCSGFLDTFTAFATGSFASNTAPIFLVPTAATVSISGQVLTPKGGGLANARVSLTNSAGETLTTITDSFGNYQFLDIIAGETVIINVKSKHYAYPSQVLNLAQETNGLNFLPQYTKERIR